MMILTLSDFLLALAIGLSSAVLASLVVASCHVFLYVAIWTIDRLLPLFGHYKDRFLCLSAGGKLVALFGWLYDAVALIVFTAVVVAVIPVMLFWVGFSTARKAWKEME